MPLIIFFLSRSFIFLITYASAKLITFPLRPNNWHVFPVNSFFDLWARWDSAFYVDIASKGYYSLPGRQSNLPFLPFYPLCLKGLNFFVGNYYLAGWLISNLACLVSLILLYNLVKERWGQRTALQATLFLAIFPTSFFCSAVYSESLFISLTLATYLAARRKHWWLAGGWASLAALTRLTGIVLVILLLLMAGQEALAIKRKKILSFLPAFLPLAAVLAFMVFLNWKVGNPLVFIQAQRLFGRQPSSIWGPLVFNLGHLSLANLFELGVFFSFLSLSLFFLRFDFPLGVYSAAMCIFPLFSGTLGSIQRFVLPLFPVFMLLGMSQNKFLNLALATTFSLFLAAMSILFTQWFYVG